MNCKKHHRPSRASQLSTPPLMFLRILLYPRIWKLENSGSLECLRQQIDLTPHRLFSFYFLPLSFKVKKYTAVCCKPLIRRAFWSRNSESDYDVIIVSRLGEGVAETSRSIPRSLTGAFGRLRFGAKRSLGPPADNRPSVVLFRPH